MTDKEYIEANRITENLYKTIQSAFIASLNGSIAHWIDSSTKEVYSFMNGERLSVMIHQRNKEPKRMNLL